MIYQHHLQFLLLDVSLNGPGEATMTDIGITGGGNDTHMIYINGKKTMLLKKLI